MFLGKMGEINLLVQCNFTNNVHYEGDDDFIKALWAGRWKNVFDTQLGHSIIRNCLMRNAGDTDSNVAGQYQELQTGISLLFAFIQSNFTGPSCDFGSDEFLNEIGLDKIDFRRELSVNGEELNVNVKHPQLLYICKKILESIKPADDIEVEINWWKLRSISIHQQVMDELCSNLYANFHRTAEWLQNNLDKLNNKELEALLMIEIGEGFLLFHRVKKCELWLERCCKLLDVEFKVEGLLGMRTKFQQKPLPQLCLRVERASDTNLPTSEETNGKTVLPQLLKLDDEVRLERVSFLKAEDNEIMTVSSLLQCLVLAKMKYILKSQPKDELIDEELEPFIIALLHQTHGPLSVRFTTLLQKICQESNSSRTIDRCLKQSEEVLLCLNSSKYSVPERLSYFFASMLLPIWSNKKQLGDLKLSLGLVKSALDSYLEIQSWEDVILCYNRLELRHKAAEIIEQELEKRPTAALYCLLGDATDDPSHYEKAWEFSEHKSGRAQRHWGNYFYFKKNYEEAVPHLQKSLKINPLQETTLLRLGYACMELGKWGLAAQTYLRYTHLEQQSFECWNNLAKALIKLGDKNRAHKVLKESLKCNFNNWKVWDNFLNVSVDTGHFEDVINAYQRLIELKEKHLDLQVLEILVKSVEDNIFDSQGRPMERLKKKVKALLAQQSVQFANEPKVWELSAVLADSELSRGHKLQKAYQAYVQTNHKWVDSNELRKKILTVCIDMCTSTLKACDSGNMTVMEKSTALSQLSSARLSSKACIAAIEKAGPTYIDECKECKDVLNDLKALVQNVQAKAIEMK